MGFIKKKISSKNIGIVDLGTHKIKVGIYSISGDNSQLIGYGEKRQDSEYTYLGELLDIEGICLNINQAIKKAEKEANAKISDIIINFPFEEVFFCHTKLNHNRKNKDIPIGEKESNNILEKINNISIDSSIKNISAKSSYIKGDLKQIIHNVSSISIDNKPISNLINNTGMNISFSVLNVFIPISKYNLLHYIGNILKKKIIKIVPIEYSLTRLFDNNKDLVIIDIGNSHISIIIKKSCDLIGVSKIPLGISDLIKQIQENHLVTKIDIINSINSNIYTKEKKHFLEIFEDCLIIGLKEIIGTQICPNNFFITGGGGNSFIKEYLVETNLNKRGLKILGKVNIIDIITFHKVPGNRKVTTNILSIGNIASSLITK